MSTTMTTAEESDYYTFGPHKIHPKDVFYTTHLSFAMVNLRPVLPGFSSSSPHLFFLLISLLLLLLLTVDRISTMSLLIHLSGSNLIALTFYVHVLIVPKRDVKRVVDLTSDETIDLWLTAQKVARMLEPFHKATSLTFTIQDGPQAGQSVPHVHIHIVPRKVGDFENNDEIYDAIDEKEKELNKQLNLDKERKDRSFEERAREADECRSLLL
ncbi:hypothetical protein Tsubulata_027398 [Turnera subulata]|uniref:Bis(5'-adenosyl)-triphosphatase n=1 Tax=Turnera subulata TaxID=218843 RepID=A0A9Q0JMH1_9ROSI|nr:hypothetical protein Tsubulata_027398 [Turnera subulata]